MGILDRPEYDAALRLTQKPNVTGTGIFQSITHSAKQYKWNV